jgi:hypothetical protein
LDCFVAEHPFRKALKKALKPILKTSGFSGTGTTWRRINDPLVHVFNIQGSSGGDGCYLNLGAHLSFLPSAGKLIPAEDTLEYHCAFRDRIDPPAGTFRWAYLEDASETNESLAFIVSEWERQAVPFFERYAVFPESFRTLLSHLAVATTQIHDLFTFARIALQLEDRERACHLAETVRSKCPRSATGLLADVQDFLLLASK